MFSLPEHSKMADIYQKEINQEQPRLSAMMDLMVTKFTNQSYRLLAENTEGTLNPDEFKDEQAEAIALEFMARDLKFYREQARNIIDNYKVRRFDLETAVARTNSLIGSLAGFRSFLEGYRASVLGDVLHARLDTRLEVCQEDIVRTLVRTADIEQDATIGFDIEQGGIHR